jgi:two-component system, OmpR family, alkaline phosphatase synthesis response regulator PhoP
MRKKILVVDDEIDTVELVSLWLKEMGFDVVSANDGEEAVRVAKEAKPDLLVLDLAMPKMHGYDVCRAVKADQSLTHTKVIITSGKNYTVDVRNAKNAGADAFLVKPYDIKQLLATIRGLLDAE